MTRLCAVWLTSACGGIAVIDPGVAQQTASSSSGGFQTRCYSSAENPLKLWLSPLNRGFSLLVSTPTISQKRQDVFFEKTRRGLLEPVNNLLFTSASANTPAVRGPSRFRAMLTFG